ncbi:thymidine phosphorylase [Entomospira nematocerorum]|uniref:thymidine phosphorylase n=1 Tax=Entomospira nematocerorum TaxID=2719987 RepID=A0A968GEM3_9SPIO|nr:thymidine phosphorylase [Entomospira nematocera]NIZ46361.1 thymidine phosphorylase [Entomospira nematocera]WDI33834.1 thymidine phosphorylase [Entomospira nematocera]
MLVTEIIAKKRDKLEHSYEELKWFIDAYVDGSIPDYQVSAWLMAVVLNGMSFEETARLTQVMIESGKTYNLQHLTDRPLVDKHSTGGVGDKISLPLAPIAAAMGLYVPMMSGRALGITGGTLDKLESIPGYRTQLKDYEFIQYIEENGYAMTGQTQDIVPADRLLYALRDVTACVESIPLITASILSKKFAEGAQSFVFDVKWGTGAFMKSATDAEKLAESLTKTMQRLGRRSVALITNMNEPLGLKMGNFLEMEESYLCLEGKGPQDVMILVERQACYMALAGGIVKNMEEAKELYHQVVASGKAKDRFLKNIEQQGGSVKEFEAMLGVYRSEHYQDIIATTTGYIQHIDAGVVGRAGLNLGVGRATKQDTVSPVAGVEFYKKSGDKVSEGEVIARAYAGSITGLKLAMPILEGAFSFSNEKVVKQSMIQKELIVL